MHPPTHTHLLFCLDAGPSKAEVTAITGILGSNITLEFTFSDPHVINHKTHLAVYIKGQKKIAECKGCSGSSVLKADPNYNSVLYQITNLKQNDSDMYWAALFVDNLIKESNKVQLDVREENKSSTGKVRLYDDKKFH